MASNLLVVGEHPIATVAILESLLPRLEALSGLPCRSIGLADLTAGDISRGALVILVRGSSFEAFHFARAMQRRRLPYGYYIDDNVWELSPEHPDGSYWRTPIVEQRVDYIVRHAAPILVATRPLRDYLSARYGDRVRQVDSPFDFSLIPELPDLRPAGRRIRGGFASSPGRGADLELAMPDVLAALDANPDLEFDVIGAAMSPQPQHERLRWFEYRPSYAEYTHFQIDRAWDFGIAPLADATSNQSKTDNKYREYAAHGIPGIYQDAPPYALVRDGETGLLAGGQRSWREAIECVVRSRELRERIRIAARTDAEGRFAIDVVISQWAQQVIGAQGIERDTRPLERALRRIRRAYANGGHSRVPALLRAANVSVAANGLGATLARAARRLAATVSARLRGIRARRTR